MSNKLIATAAIAAMFASTAFAQMSDDPAAPLPDAEPGLETQGAMPDWDASISDTFFEDEATGLVRSDQEIEERWQSLSADEQAQVRDDCATITADAGAAGGIESGETPLGSDTADAPATDELESDGMASGPVDTETTTGSTSPELESDVHAASMQQICSTIETF